MSCKLTASGVIALAVMVALFGYVKWQQKATAPPQSMEDALERIKGAGFCVGYSHTVSRVPITDEQAARLIASRDKDEWKGKVRVHYKRTDVGDPNVTRWGEVILCGDPDLIEEIVKLHN